MKETKTNLIGDWIGRQGDMEKNFSFLREWFWKVEPAMFCFLLQYNFAMKYDVGRDIFFLKQPNGSSHERYSDVFTVCNCFFFRTYTHHSDLGRLILVVEDLDWFVHVYVFVFVLHLGDSDFCRDSMMCWQQTPPKRRHVHTEWWGSCWLHDKTCKTCADYVRDNFTIMCNKDVSLSIMWITDDDSPL